MPVLHLTDKSFNEDVLRAEQPVLVDFFADWCGPCRMVAPVIEELEKDYATKVLVGKVDIDANPKAASDYGVMSIPTVILFHKGKEVARQVGFGGKDAYVKMIEAVAK